MKLKDKLHKLLHNPAAITERVETSHHLRFTASEAAMLATLAQVYGLPKNQVLRRLIRQAAIEYSQDSEVIGLLSYTHQEIK